MEVVAALLRAVPRLRGPTTWGRPLCGLWGSGQENPKRWVESTLPSSWEKPPGTEMEKFHMVYRFKAIRIFGYMSRLKVTQTVMTVVALPPAFYWYSQGLMTLDSLCLVSGIAAFAMAMLCWMSYFFQRLVGILYVNEAGTTLRVAHLTFWGRRQDSYCPVADVMPLMETRDRPQDVFVSIQQYSRKQTFYLSLRFGHVLDKERFVQIFGNMDTLK
ncbi:transmembrane protein 186 [Ctenodactylus gundi]